MSNTLYTSGRAGIMKNEIDLDDDTFVVASLSIAYTFSDSHTYADDLTGVLGTPQTLVNNHVTAAAIFTADDLSYPGVVLGETVRRLVIYKNTGVAATSPLVYYADQGDDGGPISRAGDGAGIPILWSSTGIFAL